MAKAVVILESPYKRGAYYRVDFIINALRQAGIKAKLYAFGGGEEGSDAAEAFDIRGSRLLRLINLGIYLVTLRAFPHFGYLVRLSRPLARERPSIVIFYRHWTGIFLLLWRKIYGVPASLVWEWYDLDTRMHYFNRRMGPRGIVLAYVEEQLAPRCFDGLIVPTEFARRLLERWGHAPSKIHVLGEVRGLNPHVDDATLRRREEEVRNGAPLHLVWSGVVRHYQVAGLTPLIRALQDPGVPNRRLVLDIAGPAESDAREALETLCRSSTCVAIQWHGALSPGALDVLLARGHIAVHPLPAELFTRYIYTRKMADYLAAALPVAHSSLEGLNEIGGKFGLAFNLDDPRSICGTLTKLTNPAKYGEYADKAWCAAHEEFGERPLAEKANCLVGFLMRGGRQSGYQSSDLDAETLARQQYDGSFRR